MAETERCKVKFVEDKERGWKIVIDEPSPACKRSLEEISESMGPHARNYLAKRIEAKSPEVHKILEDLKLKKK